ncbi:MAG: hypothetical protein ABFC96_06655 [Thermoguttaceae bacterium]
MSTRDATSASTLRRTWLVWTLIGLAAVWFLAHLAFFIARVCHLDPLAIRESCHELRHFFVWQTAGFFGLAMLMGLLRAALAGRVLGAYLVLSTAALLAASHNAGFMIRAVLLAAWAVSVTVGMRQLLWRAVGERYATWGVAAATVFAALVPVSFFMGLFHAITATNVGVLAVVTALPGVVLLARAIVTWERARVRAGGLTLVQACVLEAVWMALAITFVGASTMEVRSDAVRVWLPYVHQVVWDHGLSHQYACWHRLQPMAMQTCCAVFASLGSDGLAKWFSWLLLPAIALVVGDEVRVRSGSRSVALVAAAAVLGCPVLMMLSTSIYVDHAMTLLCTAGFVVLFRALRPVEKAVEKASGTEKRSDALPKAGLLGGLTLSAFLMAALAEVKYPGLIFCVVWAAALCVGLLWQRGWRRALPWSVIAGAVLVLAASPWYAYVYAGTGNPVFPYLQGLFHSPYWIEGFSLQEVYEQCFKLAPGIAGLVSFPWTATFYTHSFVEGYDGYIGFWVLALAPCCFAPFVLRRFAPARNAGEVSGTAGIAGSCHSDLAIAGVLMIGLVVSYTPYVRYWLPAYPLLVAACVLAAAPMVEYAVARVSDRWHALKRREQTGTAQLPGSTPFQGVPPFLVSVASLSLTALLLFPIMLPCQGISWDEYTGRLSRQVRNTWAFRGYPLVERLNPTLTLDDGVITTGYEGNHLIQGRAYEFPFWWCKIRRIRDVGSMADFCRRNHIHYWLVDHSAKMCRTEGYPDSEGYKTIVAEYWSEGRLVMAEGSVAVYDVTGPTRRLVGKTSVEQPPAAGGSERKKPLSHEGKRGQGVKAP